jgi:hypothetical protein
MSSRMAARVPFFVLGAAMFLAAAAPALAHPGSGMSVQSSRPIVTPEPLATSARSLIDAPGPHAMAWAVLTGTLIMAAAARRRRRALVGSALAVLLVVFAFEQALHSAHHGLDTGEAERCVIAAASAHVAGTTVDPVPAMNVIAPPPEDGDLEPDVARPAIPYPCSVLQRAPPA